MYKALRKSTGTSDLTPVRNKFTTQNQGVDMETGSTVKMRLLMMVLQGLVGWQMSSGQAHPERLQQAIYSLTRRCLPPVPHWLSTMGRTIFPDVTAPPLTKFHHFLIGYPSFSLPSLHLHFSANTFWLVYPFPQHPVCLGTLQVHQLCHVSKSLGRFRARAWVRGGLLFLWDPL